MSNGLAAIPPVALPQYDETGGTGLPPQNLLERPLAIIRRYKWLMLGIIVVSGLGGYTMARRTKPQYEARATIWIAAETPELRATGPIRSGELLHSGSWIELLRSYKVVDEVVKKLSLYLDFANPAQSPYFAGFELSERFTAGLYTLTIDRSHKTWTLHTRPRKNNPEPVVTEKGAAADSVGRKFGFKWMLPETAFTGTGNEDVLFSVMTPRETSIRLADRLNTRLSTGSNFLWLSYSDQNPRVAAQTLNTWINEYVSVAVDLKKRNTVEFSRILEGQLQYAEQATRDAESAYQNFRVNAITLPTEGGPVAAGVLERERDPALLSYFDQKIAYDNLRHDREALETTIANAAKNSVPYEGLLFIPSVAQSPGAEALREAFRQRYQLRARLAAERQHFTDQHPVIKDLQANIDVVENHTIPELANRLLSQMRDRESDYERRINSASKDLEAIPPRTIEERRLNRAVVVAEDLYTHLKARYAEAKLAEASATPDVSVLDTAVVPLSPTKNTKKTILLMAVMAGFAAAVGLALLLDRFDSRFHYAHQAVADLGIEIASAVPRIPKRGVAAAKQETADQFVESFRTLRMHVTNNVRNKSLRLAVTSASPGDGKSLVSSNLAQSCAKAGLRTVLVDGDTRRGTLHKTFGISMKRGLTDYLLGKIHESQLLKESGHTNLYVITSGQRTRTSPELLTSAKLARLIDHLGQSFDAVIVDTPPLAAGIDAYAIAAATGNLLMVLRMGHTDRRLAFAKMSLLDRLPVDVVGSVLNEVPDYGESQYYATYSVGYGVSDEPSVSTDLVEVHAQ